MLESQLTQGTSWVRGARAPQATSGPRSAPPSTATVVAIGTLALALGCGVTFVLLPLPAQRLFPWVIGRAFGIAAYLDLAALVSVGTWFRHPWRHRWPLLRPALAVRLHAGLGVSAVGLVGAHVVSLVLDPYARVGMVGALVPGLSGYRPLAVALGTLALYLGLLVGGTAAMAGSWAGRRWLGVHRLGAASFVLVWIHGVLAGSDAIILRPLYLVTGLGVLVLATSRRMLAESP